MEFIELTPDKYKEWDDFCSKSDDAWFWHTSSWLEYNLNYRPELKPESKSFMVKLDSKIVAACPLILINNHGVKEFSYPGVHGCVPAFSNDLNKKTREKAMKFIFNTIDDLAVKNEVYCAKLCFSVLSKSYMETSAQKFNFPEKFAYLNNTLNAQVINLTKSIDDLRSDIRHGHDADIDRASKILKMDIFDKNNISKEIFDQYIGLHRKASGKITRPEITFKIMFDLIGKGNAFLAGAKKGDEYIGFSYFFWYKNNVFYGSGCNDPDFPDIPIAHFIHWNAIKWMKNNGCKHYEIGWQFYTEGMSDYATKKRINISSFERGFGGEIIPLFMAEKYYNKEFFLKIYKDRIKKFAATIK